MITIKVGGYYLALFFVISHNFEGVDLFEKEYLRQEDQSFLRKQVQAANIHILFIFYA